MKVGILSDTHGYRDPRYAEYFAGCDQIWHAGDIGDYTIVEELAEIAPVHAVCGNVDTGTVRRRCPELDIFEAGGARVLLTHIGGYPGRWSPGMKKLLKENAIDIMVDGHSHILKVMRDPELGVLHINPGAAGQQGWHRVRTLVRLTIEGGRPTDCEVIELTGKTPCQ